MWHHKLRTVDVPLKVVEGHAGRVAVRAGMVPRVCRADKELAHRGISLTRHLEDIQVGRLEFGSQEAVTGGGAS